MAHIPTSNQPDWPGGAYDAPSGAALICVAASAQQDPGAIQRCPVCGQPYASGAQPLLGPQADAPPASEQETTQATETSGARIVFRCARCGTYSAGSLDGAGEKVDG